MYDLRFFVGNNNRYTLHYHLGAIALAIPLARNEWRQKWTPMNDT